MGWYAPRLLLVIGAAFNERVQGFGIYYITHSMNMIACRLDSAC
jgi:hypothetical protein